MEHRSDQVDGGVKVCLHVVATVVYERLAHVLDFAEPVVPTAWHAMDGIGIVLDPDVFVVPSASRLPSI